MRSKQWLLHLPLGLLVFVAQAQGAGYEGVAYGVNNYSTCDAGNLYWCKGDAESFSKGLDDIGYGQTSFYWDDKVDGRDFIDSMEDHIDPSGTDHADVALFSGHGDHDCNGVGSSTLVMGDNEDGCYPTTNDRNSTSSDQQMRFGEGGNDEDLDVLITFACEAAHWCVFKDGGYNGMGQYFNTPNADPFRVLMGFHGISYDSPWNQTKLRDYVNEAESNGLGDAYVDKFYKNRALSSYDQCPSFIAWTDNKGGADQQYDNGGFQDIKNIIDGPDTAYFYSIIDCNPNDGEKLDMLD